MTQVSLGAGGGPSAKPVSPLLPFLRPVAARIARRAASAGNKARDEKRWGDAAEAYAKFLRLRPNSPAVWAQLGHCLKEGGNPAAAEAAYLKAMELDPKNPDIILHVGRIKLALNDPAAAAHYLERAASIDSPSLSAARELQALRSRSADDALSAADKARDEKRWPEAIEAYTKYLVVRPEAAKIWVQLGHCWTESENRAEAEKAYLKSLELEPENPDTLLHLGRIKLALNDPKAAARYFERAATLPAPGLDAREGLLALWLSRAAHDSCGDKAQDENHWVEEIKSHAECLGNRREAVKFWIELGDHLSESESSLQAERAYLKALELEPENAGTLLHIGRFKLARHDTSSAEHYLDRAARAPSPSLDAVQELQMLRSAAADRALSLADSARDNMRWSEATEAYRAFLGLRPDEAEVWIQLGHCLEEDGKPTEAERAYFKALKLDPDDAGALLHIAHIKLALDDASSAGDYLERAETFLSPSADATPELHILRSRAADLALSLGDRARADKRWAEAIAAYRTFLNIRPDVARIWVQLSHCLREGGKTAEADEAYIKSMGLGSSVRGTADTRITRILPCKLCNGPSRIVFGLPHNKKAGHPIPAEPDDCWYYQCDDCNFLFTPALDVADHTEIYDDTYWKKQDPEWYGRVSQTFRLIAMANEMLKQRLDRIEILDFGCGVGAFIESARKDLALKVWGTDILPPRFGKEWFLKDLGERKFHVITACEVIEHLPNPREVFANIRQHLKSPGVFAFQTGQWDPKLLGRDWWYLGPHNGHISLYSREGLDHVFKEMGGADRRMWTDYPGCQAWLFN